MSKAEKGSRAIARKIYNAAQEEFPTATPPPQKATIDLLQDIVDGKKSFFTEKYVFEEMEKLAVKGDWFLFWAWANANNHGGIMSSKKTQFLHHMTGDGHAKAVEILTDSGYDIRGLFTYDIRLHNGEKPNSRNHPKTKTVQPIHVAAQIGSVPILKILIDRGVDPETLENLGVDPETLNDCGETPAFIAAVNKCPEALEFLVSRGARIDRKVAPGFPNAGRSPHRIAAAAKCNDIVLKYLTPELSTADYINELIAEASTHDNPELVDELRNRLKELNTKPQESDSHEPFQRALISGSKRMVEYFLEQQPSLIESTTPAFLADGTSFGVFPLYIAALRNHGHLVDLLIDTYNRNPNEADILGETPLIVACNYNSLYAIAALLSHGANPNLASKNGLTPLKAALKNNYMASITLLLTAPGISLQDVGPQLMVAAVAAGDEGEAVVKELVSLEPNLLKNLQLLAESATTSSMKALLQSFQPQAPEPMAPPPKAQLSAAEKLQIQKELLEQEDAEQAEAAAKKAAQNREKIEKTKKAGDRKARQEAREARRKLRLQEEAEVRNTAMSVWNRAKHEALKKEREQKYAELQEIEEKLRQEISGNAAAAEKQLKEQQALEEQEVATIEERVGQQTASQREDVTTNFNLLTAQQQEKSGIAEKILATIPPKNSENFFTFIVNVIHFAVASKNVFLINGLAEKLDALAKGDAGPGLTLKSFINIKNEKGQTPLHSAVLLRDQEMIEILIGHGAGADISNGLPFKTHHSPFEKTSRDIAKTNNFAYRMQQGRLESFIDSCEEIIDMMQERMNEDFSPTEPQVTPLHFNLRIGNLAGAKILLEKGFNPQVKDLFGVTPLDLMHKIYSNHLQLYKTFLTQAQAVSENLQTLEEAALQQETRNDIPLGKQPNRTVTPKGVSKPASSAAVLLRE